MLNLGGKLTMIISNRFQTGLYLHFKVFDIYLQILRKDNPDNVKIEPIGNFKTSSNVTKGMETNFGMVCITLKKIGNLLMDLSTERSIDDEERLKNQGLAVLKKENAKERRDAKKEVLKTKVVVSKKSVKGSALHVKTLKRLIDNSYQRKDKNGKLKQKEYNIDGYNLDNNLTNDTSAVYYNKDKNHVVHSVRGTNGTLKDWSNNAIYMASPELYKKTDRYLNAKEIQKRIDDKYTTAKKTMTTHSQSGIIGRHLGVANPNLEVISLNPATYNKDNNIDNPNEYTVKSTKDLVSLYHKNKPRDTIIKGESLDQYKEHDIGLLDRLNPNLLIGNGAYYFK
jgi:putative lipase involved disintegration of autophagic bodies